MAAWATAEDIAQGKTCVSRACKPTLCRRSDHRDRAEYILIGKSTTPHARVERGFNFVCFAPVNT
jgi:hypothetical protein